MPPNIDKIAEDLQSWKQDEMKDVVQSLYGTIGNVLEQIVEHAFQAGWDYRDRRYHAAVGKKKKTKQQEGREGLGIENGRTDTAKLGKKVAQKGRHKKR